MADRKLSPRPLSSLCSAMSLSLRPQHEVRMIVLGSAGVGKTQLVSRLVGQPFNTNHFPTAKDFHVVNHDTANVTYRLEILDTSGISPYPPTMEICTLMTGDLFLIVYSASDYGSWERAKYLIDTIEQIKCYAAKIKVSLERNFKNVIKQKTDLTKQPWNLNNHSTKESIVSILVVGNKHDISKSTVPRREVDDWLLKRQFKTPCFVSHIEASAKTYYNVEAMYDQLLVMAKLPLGLNSVTMHAGNFPPRSRSNPLVVSPLCYKDRTARNSFLFHEKNIKATRNKQTDSNSIKTAQIQLMKRPPSLEDEIILAYAKACFITKKKQGSSKILSEIIV
uniref:GTP-binding protein Rhes-like n=1 Tax=Styela clava TaxID=7725 RepID=UPI001939FCF8|nr:GTP-binding protein Rhes-like [Styela clava]